MIVQHNMASANTNRMLGISTSNLSKSTEKLSSGYRINRASDDAAGLSISEKMRGQISGLEKASDNAQDGISLIQTAEGAMNEQHAILQRARELAVQAANDTNVSADRTAIADELNTLEAEYDRINTNTEFNTMKLLMKDDDGAAAGARNQAFSGKNLQVGANSGQNITISIAAINMTSISANVSDYTSATKSIEDIDKNITDLSSARSKLGALQNRLEYAIRNSDNTAENLQSAESRIRDVDMAEEMTKYSKESIIQQAAQSMLAQANQQTQGVMTLLQ